MNTENNDLRDYFAAIGCISANWELLLDVIEDFLLQLAGCPDYRGRVLTQNMGIRQQRKAIRVLLKEIEGEAAVTSTEYKRVWTQIESLERERNSAVHNACRVIDNSAGIVSFSSADAMESLTTTIKRTDTEELDRLGGKIVESHTAFLNLMLTSGGYLPSFGTYDLPVKRTPTAPSAPPR